jgi:hypothetical protein
VALDGSCTITNTLQQGAEIPTLSGWAMMILMGLMALVGVAVIPRLAP